MITATDEEMALLRALADSNMGGTTERAALRDTKTARDALAGTWKEER